MAFPLFKKKIMKKTYDREHMKPVIRASICTGEEVAGFKDIRTGKIEEIMLIRSPEDLEKFKEIYEITEEIAKIHASPPSNPPNINQRILPIVLMTIHPPYPML